MGDPGDGELGIAIPTTVFSALITPRDHSRPSPTEWAACTAGILGDALLARQPTFRRETPSRAYTISLDIQLDNVHVLEMLIVDCAFCGADGWSAGSQIRRDEAHEGLT